ncbi:MAG: F0F1 ATP synthase subunit B [Acidobacteriota bacterium]
MQKTRIHSLCRVAAAAVVGLFLVTAPLFAAGGGEGGSGGPFDGDIGNALWTLVIFLLVLWVLSKYAWGPLLDGLKSRETFIRESLEQAKKERLSAEARQQEYADKLQSIRNEAEAILEEARRDASALRHREEEAAKAEAEKTIERARREIEIARDTAVKDLYQRATQLATTGASQILQRELKAEDHERLIADVIDSIDRVEAN